jgi:hypothetical protein
MPSIDHLSGLWGAYPGPEITATNMTLLKAASTTMQTRIKYAFPFTYIPTQITQSSPFLNELLTNTHR